MVYRRNDWRSKLRLWADQQVGRPLIWGETDCASLARQALSTMFDREVMPHLPPWHSAAEALRVHAAHGPMDAALRGLSMADVVMPLAYVRAGDIIVSTERDEAVGKQAAAVCLDGLECLTSGPDGVRTYRLNVEVEKDFSRAYSIWDLRTDG